MSTPISGDIQCWFRGFHWWTGLQFQQFLNFTPSLYVWRLIAMVNLVWWSDVSSTLVANLKLPEFNTKNALRLDLPEKFTMFFFLEGLVQWLRARCFFWQALEIPVRELLPWWTPPGCSSSIFCRIPKKSPGNQTKVTKTHWEKLDWDHRDDVLGDMPRIANY